MASVNKGDWDRSAGFQQDVDFHRRWISEALRVLKPSGTIAISGTYHSIYVCGFILLESGCRIINDIAWFKPNAPPALACRNFTASHETVIWASKNKKVKHTFNYEVSKSWDDPKDSVRNQGKQMRSVWSISSPSNSEKRLGKHPTQKPLQLLSRLIEICTNVGDLVLDPFCGSGTSGVVAISAGRQYIGIDSDSEYIELSKKRLGALNEDHATHR
jgi:site-specific DNA-methyltransferase (adenine-specific)